MEEETPDPGYAQIIKQPQTTTGRPLPREDAGLKLFREVGSPPDPSLAPALLSRGETNRKPNVARNPQQSRGVVPNPLLTGNNERPITKPVNRPRKSRSNSELVDGVHSTGNTVHPPAVKPKPALAAKPSLPGKPGAWKSATLGPKLHLPPDAVCLPIHVAAKLPSAQELNQQKLCQPPKPRGNTVETSQPPPRVNKSRPPPLPIKPGEPHADKSPGSVQRQARASSEPLSPARNSSPTKRRGFPRFEVNPKPEPGQQPEVKGFSQEEAKKTIPTGSDGYALPSKPNPRLRRVSSNNKEVSEQDSKSTQPGQTSVPVARTTNQPSGQSSQRGLMLRYRRRFPSKVDQNSPPPAPATKPSLQLSDADGNLPSSSSLQDLPRRTNPPDLETVGGVEWNPEDIYDQVDGAAKDASAEPIPADAKTRCIDVILEETENKEQWSNGLHEHTQHTMAGQESLPTEPSNTPSSKEVLNMPRQSLDRTGYKQNTEPLYDDPAFDVAKEEEECADIDEAFPPPPDDLYEPLAGDAEEEELYDNEELRTHSSKKSVEYALPVPKAHREQSVHVKKPKADEKKKKLPVGEKTHKKQQELSKLIAKQRKQFKLTGHEEAEFVATAKATCHSGPADFLTYQSGDKFAVLFSMPSIRRTLPPDTWLVQATDGTYGFVEIPNMQVLPQTTKEDAMRDEDEVIDAMYASVGSLDLPALTERSDATRYTFSHSPVTAVKPQSLLSPPTHHLPPPPLLTAEELESNANQQEIYEEYN